MVVSSALRHGLDPRQRSRATQATRRAHPQRRIRKIEPVLQKVNAQHDPETHRLATFARFGIKRLDQSFNSDQGTTDSIACKNCSGGWHAHTSQTRLTGKCYLAHRNLHSTTSLRKLAVEIGLIQSIHKTPPRPKGVAE